MSFSEQSFLQIWNCLIKMGDLVGVVGATGTQGGSVVKYLLAAGSFRLRGICRNADSPAAQRLKTKGVEVVSTNLDDVDRLKQAFRGCDFVYGVTNFWEHGEDGETRQGKNMVDAAKAEGVRHFVFSTMGMTSNGLAVSLSPHSGSKGLFRAGADSQQCRAFRRQGNLAFRLESPGERLFDRVWHSTYVDLYLGVL